MFRGKADADDGGGRKAPLVHDTKVEDEERVSKPSFKLTDHRV